ncbi:multidrug resistance-associated ABC transporter [Cubamyces sp. BRFM 1775]|nr:multidrug resistance-associated ABC transporter [Cubamyces sp. BRFM 1775]
MAIMTICDGTSVTSLYDPCVRSFWAAVLPFALVVLLLVSVIPPIPALLRVLKKPFENYLPLSEAEALLYGEDDGDEGEESKDLVPLWRTLVLSTLSLVECLLWVGVGCYSLVNDSDDLWNGGGDLLIAVSWFYAALRPIVRPTATVPIDLFLLFGLHILLGLFILCGHVYDYYAHVIAFPPPSVVVMASAALFVGLAGFAIVASMPARIPSGRIKREDIGKSVSPEDYTTAWGWMSFRWVTPLVDRGSHDTLNEADIWSLSPTMRARPLHIKFSRSTGKLVKRLWRANSLDLVMDFILTYASIVFNYAGPFFLKRILDALDTSELEGSPEKKALAFVYAFLAFASSLLKSQADAQHLWFGRRAATRIRLELMSSIYDKALKRKDFSGVVDKGSGEKGKVTGQSNATTSDSKENAGVGKIVNLMAGDANRVSQFAGAIYYLYGAPFEIIVASIFLYRLLGWAAFMGYVVLLLTWPLNKLLATRTQDISKSLAIARDKRMGVLHELIGAIKFIKFFAWEDRWVERVTDARKAELQWMAKSYVNSACFSLIWICAPILVSLTSFYTYIAQGNELTIGTAFASLALFRMIRLPLNIIPAFIVQAIQTKVSIDRIAAFLDEDEVDEQVSTLKKGHVPPSEDNEEGLGIINGTFKWNETEANENAEGSDKSTSGSAGASGAEASGAEPGPSEGESTVSGGAPTRDQRFELKDINVMFPEGKFSVITGPTASGKSALLMALLGELTTLGGRVVMSKNASKVDEHGLSHTISYAAQSPWLRHQSIRDNILFGYPYDEERYNAVVRCCALEPDLEILEDGDATEIGARGVNLSGGQKARVALARAVYAPTKYVLLDDPLSAVDSHTARFLFEELFMGLLLAHRTVILVTHHVDLVFPGTHYLVRMLGGRIDTQGTVSDLRSNGVLDDIAQLEDTEAQKRKPVETTRDPAVEIEAEAPDQTEAKLRKPRKLVEDEHRETGSVEWDVYKAYLQTSSYWIWGTFLALIALTHVLGVGEKLWIRVWGEAYTTAKESGSGYAQMAYLFRTVATQHVMYRGVSYSESRPPAAAHNAGSSLNSPGITLPSVQEHPYFYIGVYSAIALIGGLVNTADIATQFVGALRASRVLFDKMLRTVVRATMRWYDVTPQGRILNRFSKDIETIDTAISETFHPVNYYIILTIVSVVTIIVVLPLFIFPAIVLGFFYYRYATAFLNTNRDLRRMESNTRSPVFANFTEMLEGIVTVRAFGAEQRFLDNLYDTVDLTTRIWYMSSMTNRWLLVTFDTLGATGILATTLFALSGYQGAGMAGVCITSAIAFTESVSWTCRFWADVELDFNSVERVVEYFDLPQEPPTIIESNRPPAYWPSSTSPNKDSLLAVENLVIKYAPDLPPVLHGISFTLRAKERVGLLGRTGSGKSTLAMSLLRFVDPAVGRIIIDGIDISTIGLHDLRSRITFIPQDATLFSGTLRDNLDPFGDHTDAECLDVLHRVHMLSDSQLASQRPSRAASVHENEPEATVASVSPSPTETEGKTVVALDSQVSPGGTNFSQGQRQLIAMARALLRRSAIIILDEATSSIDFTTDAKIQATIREEFDDSLLLTVAHRLRTVIDYDRLIVLDNGKIAEFDTPLNLIHKEGGIFRGMCVKSGTFGELEAAAKAKAQHDSEGASGT